MSDHSTHTTTADPATPAPPGRPDAPRTTRRQALGLAAGLLGAGALGFRLPVPESALLDPGDPTAPAGGCGVYYDDEYEDLLAAVDESQFDFTGFDPLDPGPSDPGPPDPTGACGAAGSARGPAPHPEQWSADRTTNWARGAAPQGPWSWTGGPDGRWVEDDRALCPDTALSEGARGVAAGQAVEAEQAAAAPSRPWARPLTRRYRITTGYRVRGNWLAGYHTGVDLAVPHGTPVWAVGAGTVVLARWSGAYGKAVTVRMRDGRYALYAHLSKIAVRPGTRVYAGRRIGNSGNTGRSTGPHLHLEIRARRGYGSDINPVRYLARRGIRL